MRRLLQFILLKPVLWANEKFSSRPQKERIFPALTELFNSIRDGKNKKGLRLALNTGDKYIIFSDQHKGTKNGADDFMKSEGAYLAALEYYLQNDYGLISLGDSEELWENTLGRVKKNNLQSFEAEKAFLAGNRFYKIFGNHDLYWANDPFAWWQLKNIYGQDVKIYEGLILELLTGGKPLEILLTHGHQGDANSDGNAFSKFFVSRIWGPLQAYLRINPNTPAYDERKKTAHNHLMYEWSAQQSCCILVTGHTHQPVFGSLTHLERLYKKLLFARHEGDEILIRETEKEIRKREREYKSVSIDYLKMQPTYFNTGCCCFRDGDITGIEITQQSICLVKWSKEKQRVILEQSSFSNLFDAFQPASALPR